MAAADPAREGTGPLGRIVVVALVLLLAFQLAYWTWAFLAPRTVAQATAEEPPIDLGAVARLFGAAPPTATAAAPSSSGLKLKGVVAPRPGSTASAIFSTGSGRDVAVHIGSEVQPGVKLSAVHPDHVTLSRAGVEERIDLEAHRSTGGNRAGSPGVAAAGFKLNVARPGPNAYIFSRNELDQALRDPQQLNYLGALGNPAGGGVRMEQAPPGSLAQKLGLQAGDVIKRVNGQTVASQGDLARLYTQFNVLSSIQAEVLRGGTTVQLTYTVNP